jgi:8-oxo-dGTP pyrophosphatase MutT (NUDIX family)
MKTCGVQAFWTSLDARQQAELLALRQHSRHQPPADWIRWYCDEACLGWISPQRAAWLAQQLTPVVVSAQALHWQTQTWSPAQRSECLQSLLLQARAEGLLQGWRDERFSFWDTDCALPDPQRPALLQVERSGFRFLGLLSHAVHVNGFLSDGRLWCGRRSLQKATDPGMLDNVTAGGLPGGELVTDCLRRELAEEAGLFSLEDHDCRPAGLVRTTRQEGDSWHDEFIHVFNLTLAADFQPRNQDGEVAEFLCLHPAEVLVKIRGGAFTQDAVQSLVQGLCNGARDLAKY